jgi:hypothetical protein
MNASTSDLVLKTYILMILTTLIADVLIFFDNRYVFIGGVVLIGLFYGAIPAFVIQIVNRCTFPSAMSTAILMGGVNVGVLLMPYIVDFLWDKTPIGVLTRYVLLGLFHALCVTLLGTIKHVRYCYQE